MRPSALTKRAFVDRFGPVYEASPWVAEGVWPAVEHGSLDDLETLASAMREVVDSAPRERRLDLIRAHPQLAVASNMAPASIDEQRGAGLDRCLPEELAEFQRLNAAYVERFSHPFIVAVKGLSRGDILAAFEARLDNDAEAEFATALSQIHRIAGFRLAALFGTE
ncbi:2-oxo-4-hydroxy-4-carboxy-5-ureidoimidazoline decarboxylase [Sphingomonas sp.]|jgi:OHCU decarboxylase|uniref:2-oxo-4-hydroxy-4-carboxy-5-ureidoimidazoline decarboxylase n=1 Tax=Sphingomonas sp. TaxID=28214 RepID=UPI002E3666C6|nr:2-oxo-4-hydroxy-4-carboxy-5-ureidoimidazoline decarboxylase [Sphingomonas sp.]HEX4695212.1 2-oxo-4-hydroxy-4-carboxy-5-ureidoimidazoline decarboxylase [Sphingomonas sp.]